MAGDAQQRLLDRARRGESDALGELLRQFRPYVRLLVQGASPRKMQARHDDSDLIQDVMLTVHQAFPYFKGESIGQFVGWLRTVALRTVGHAVRNQFATGKRSISREQVIADVDQLPQLEVNGDGGQYEHSARLATILDRLPDDMRDLLLGRFFDELSYSELSRRMGRSEGALRVLYTRALRRLREEMSREPPE